MATEGLSLFGSLKCQPLVHIGFQFLEWRRLSGRDPVPGNETTTFPSVGYVAKKITIIIFHKLRS